MSKRMLQCGGKRKIAVGKSWKSSEQTLNCKIWSDGARSQEDAVVKSKRVGKLSSNASSQHASKLKASRIILWKKPKLKKSDVGVDVLMKKTRLSDGDGVALRKTKRQSDVDDSALRRMRPSDADHKRLTKKTRTSNVDDWTRKSGVDNNALKRIRRKSDVEDGALRRRKRTSEDENGALRRKQREDEELKKRRLRDGDAPRRKKRESG
mmetsp:Transcript_82964/g.144069  ORF Transcript_82964/g.144069 Transcript_82964/m.144069 type:complete len:209 (+) Transcript_82964:498-1124(+)